MGWVELLVVLGSPILVALVTKEVAHSGLKAVLLAGIAALTAVGAAFVANEGIVTEDVLLDAVRNFTVAVAAYYGLLKPTGVTEAVQHKTAELGVG